MRRISSIRGIEPREFWMSWRSGSQLDLWETSFALTTAYTDAGHFGQEGTYL
jgi:hypothetical protein